MSCLHPPRPHQSSLTTRTAFVNVLLLCNFTSKLKIDRRLGQTVFGVRKQQNSYKMCLWLHQGNVPLGNDNNWDITTFPAARRCWVCHISKLLWTYESCKGPFRGNRQRRKRELHKQICMALQLNPLSPPSLIVWFYIQGCRILQILPYKNSQERLRSEAQSTVWVVSTVTADCRVLLAVFWSKDPLKNIIVIIICCCSEFANQSCKEPKVRNELCCRTSSSSDNVVLLVTR